MLVYHATGSSWRYHVGHLLLASLLLTHFLAHLVGSKIWILADTDRGIRTSRCCREKSLWLSWHLILGVVECSVVLRLS